MSRTRILICLLLAAYFLLTPWVHGDGIGHFVFLRSAIVDGDLELGNEYDYLTEHITQDAGGLPGRLLRYSAHRPGYHRGYHRPDPDPVTGRIPSNWSIGPALLWAPAYALAHGLSLAAAAAGLPVRTDGYGGLYYPAVALTTFGLGVAGLLIAFNLAARVVGRREGFWATLAIAAASPLLYYLYMAPSHSHALTVFTGSLLLHAWYSARDRATAVTWLQWGALGGLAFLVRWNDAILLVPIALAESWRLLRGRALLPWVRAMALLGAGFALVAWPQFAVWQHLHGRPWIRHSVDTFALTPAGLWGTLFSWNHGLFTWTPLVLFAVLGLGPLRRRDPRLAWVACGCFAALVISNCTVYDWWAGTAFGQRRMISGTPVYILGLAALFAWAARDGARRFARWLPPGALALFGLWNVSLLGQFALGMISHTEAVPFAQMVANQPRLIERLFDLARQLVR